MSKIALNAYTIEGFVDKFLLDTYEEKRPIKQFHRHWWSDVTSQHPRIALAAPRGHSKSTSINHAYGLAAALFQQHPFQLKVSKTYDLACEKLRQAKEELVDNDKIRAMFGFHRFIREREDDFIAELHPPHEAPYQFRMSALGMQQATRGVSWGTMRPTLIQGDDMEDDEEVLNRDRRDKAWRWVLRTLLPIGGENTQFRIYGTILHTDSVLARLLKDDTWKSSIYQACDENVSEESILWPEKFSRERLLEIKQGYINGGDLAGFNMEYRNVAVDTTTSFFRPEDFRPMTEEDHKKSKRFYVGGDLAFSKKDHRDYTVLVVGGVDEDGILHVVDVRRGRWDGKEVIDQMYSIEAMCQEMNGEGVDEWYIEHGAIKATLGTALEMRMAEEGYLNIAANMIPTKDKAVRAVPVQARMRARGVRFDTEATWFPEYKSEMLEFTQNGTRGAHDDCVDATAWLGQGLKRMIVPLTEDEEELEEWMQAKEAAQASVNDDTQLWTGLYGQH